MPGPGSPLMQAAINSRLVIPAAVVKPWSPYDLAPGLLIAAFDAELLSSIERVGSVVSKWTDTVQGIQIAQPISAYRPVYVAEGLNSRAALQFDGTDDGLFILGGVTGFPSGASPTESWALVRQDRPASDVTGCSLVVTGITNATNTDRRMQRLQATAGGNRSTLFLRAGTTSSSVTVADPSNFEGVCAARAVFADTLAAYVNNNAGATRAPPSGLLTGSGRLAIGQNATASLGSHWMGLVNSVYLTNPLSAPDVARMWTFLKNRGGLSYNV